MNGKEAEEKNMMSGVGRTIKVLEVLSKRGAINLETLSKETELPKATLLRFLSTLSSLGYVCRDDADRYSLTLKLFTIGSRALKNTDLIAKAKPFAKALCEELGETVHIGIEEENKAVYVLKEESSYTIRMYSRVGKVIPLYCTAIGKIFLSQKSDSELNAYFNSTNLKPFTARTLRTPEAIKEQLSLIRKRGWAIDDQEHEENMMCIAAPIRDYTGNIIASMSVSWPLFRFYSDNFDTTVKAITNATDQISAIMGYDKEEEE